MNRRLKLALLAQLALTTGVVACSNAWADNWMRSEGELYFKGGLEYERADARWDRYGVLQSQSCAAANWKHDQSYEYGLSYYHTLFGSFDYMQRRCGDVTETGMGDISFGVRGRVNILRNGRSWEAAAIVPTGDTSFGLASHTARRYGLRLGLFGSLGERTIVNGEPKASVEAGANLIIWQGSAPEQFSGYLKYNLVPEKKALHYFASLEGNYALVDRSNITDSAVNSRELYGYDTLKLRLGFSTRASLYWRMTLEVSEVLKARNASDARAIGLSFSKMLMD